MDNIPIPGFWLVCALAGTFVAILATTYVVATEYPPIALLLKKVGIQFLVWRSWFFTPRL